ncbi:hypothetical protein RRG08_050272 [Elysia crispata]|uniref:Uncharacterized protein n=1 Tax=Elysia crispata TaxID=231223 RepID=A0AAE1B3A8_9GAST|nr:hypothetical protein RRG08_050272 [Elysia crispata]
MAEESSGPGGYIPVPVILEPLDDACGDKGGEGFSRHDENRQSNDHGGITGENIAATNDSSGSSSSNKKNNNSSSSAAPQAACSAAAPHISGGHGNLRRRQQPGAGTSEESTPLTLRRCIQSPHGGASPEPGGCGVRPPGALLSVEEGDSILEASSVEGDPPGGNSNARRISGCSSGSAISSGISPRAGQHHVVVVATPVPSPACGVGAGGCGNGKNCPGDSSGDGGPDSSNRAELHDGTDQDNQDNHNNPNDSEDGEDLLFPGFAPKTFYVLDQKNYFRLWCLRCITWPYPFA